jgi:hypothetical protein
LRFSEGLAIHRTAIQIEEVPDFRHQGAQSARVIEVLHEKLARWPDIGQDRYAVRNLVEDAQRQIESATPCEGHQMDDGVGRTPDGHIDGYGVPESGKSENVLGFQIFPHHFHDPLAAIDGQPGVIRIGRRDRRCAGQGHTQGFR